MNTHDIRQQLGTEVGDAAVTGADVASASSQPKASNTSLSTARPLSTPSGPGEPNDLVMKVLTPSLFFQYSGVS